MQQLNNVPEVLDAESSNASDTHVSKEPSRYRFLTTWLLSGISTKDENPLNQYMSGLKKKQPYA